MSRRTSLPGAAELFRATSGSALAAESVGDDIGSLAAPERAVPDFGLDQPPRQLAAAPPPEEVQPLRRSTTAVRRTARRAAGPGADRAPSGRERHEEKITVYCSADELVDLESARLALRAEHGLAVDRGRIVREALAVVLADLQAKGEASVLVRRLSGR